MITADQMRIHTANAKKIEQILPQIESGMLREASLCRNTYETEVHPDKIALPIRDLLEGEGYWVEVVQAAQPLHYFLRVKW